MRVVSLSVILSVALAAQDSRPKPRDVFGVGWQWELMPTRLRDGYDPKAATPPKVWAQYGESSIVPSGHLSLVLTAAGHPVLTHVRTGANPQVSGTAATDYRPVLFTTDGKPVWSTMAMGTARGGLAETRYVFPVVKDPATIKSYAVGILDLDGKRERAQEAEARRQQLGASVLPLPLLGERLEFELPTLDGGRFSAKEHLGKVVLIDSWATW